MKTDPSQSTAVVAAYMTRHDAEIAREFLADQGIDAFVVADNVHVSLQWVEGARLVVMQRLAQTALHALADANLLPDSLETDASLAAEDVPPGDEARGAPGLYEDAEAEGASGPNVAQKIVLATAAATLVLMVLFYIPWRVDYRDAIMWAPAFRSPLSHTTTFQELGRARLHYEAGAVAFDILLFQVLGILAVGWSAWVLAGAVAGSDPDDEL